MHNKVVTTLARLAHELGAPSLRFNYRGVGASDGSFDESRGETDDALAAVAVARQRWPQAVLWLAGFSFGGTSRCVPAHARSESRATGHCRASLHALLRVGIRMKSSSRPCPWLVMQGDADEVIDPQ